MGLAIDNIINAAHVFEERRGSKLSAFKMSRQTLDALIKQVPLIHTSSASRSIYGIPVIMDESVPFGRFQIVLPKT